MDMVKLAAIGLLAGMGIVGSFQYFNQADAVLPVTVDVAGPAETVKPVRLDAADLVVDWDELVGQKVTLRGRVWGAREDAVQLDIGPTDLQMVSINSDLYRELLKDCDGYRQNGCIQVFTGTLEEGDGFYTKLLSNPVRIEIE
jgi:hypothetical protein